MGLRWEKKKNKALVVTGGWLQMTGWLWGRVVCTVIQVESKTYNHCCNCKLFLLTPPFTSRQLVLMLLAGIIETNIKLIALTLSARIELITAVPSHELFALCNWRRERFYFILHTFFSPVSHIEMFFFPLRAPAPPGSTHHRVAWPADTHWPSASSCLK